MDKNSIWFLKSMLKQFEEASCYFRDYLNSNNKKIWDLYNMKSLGWISLAQIIDHNLMPSECFSKLRKIKEYAKTQYNYSEYISNKEHPLEDAVEVFKTLSNLKKEIEILLKSETKRLNLEDKISKKVA